MWESSPPSQCLFQRSQIPSPTEDWLPPHTLQPHLPDFFGWYQLSLTGHGKRTLSWAFTGTEGRVTVTPAVSASQWMTSLLRTLVPSFAKQTCYLPPRGLAVHNQSLFLPHPPSLPPYPSLPPCSLQSCTRKQGPISEEERDTQGHAPTGWNRNCAHQALLRLKFVFCCLFGFFFLVLFCLFSFMGGC